MHCDVVFFQEVSLKLFPKLCWGGSDGNRNVVPGPGCIDGKGKLTWIFILKILSLLSYGAPAVVVPRTTR